MVGDPISDFITTIKMGGLSKKESVSLPSSKLKEAIADLLVAEGYLAGVSKKKKGGKTLEVQIAYKDGAPRISDVARVSKLSRRVYAKSTELRPFKNGFGRIILSTPKGLMTEKQAIKQKLGGEVLFKIW